MDKASKADSICSSGTKARNTTSREAKAKDLSVSHEVLVSQGRLACRRELELCRGRGFRVVD